MAELGDHVAVKQARLLRERPERKIAGFNIGHALVHPRLGKLAQRWHIAPAKDRLADLESAPDPGVVALGIPAPAEGLGALARALAPVDLETDRFRVRSISRTTRCVSRVSHDRGLAALRDPPSDLVGWTRDP